MFRTALAAAAFVGCLIVGSGQSALAQDYQLNVNTALTPEDPIYKGLETFRDKVAERTDGKVEIRPVMYLALSYDHRLVDGREAVQFLVTIKENIEDPRRLLLEV